MNDNERNRLIARLKEIEIEMPKLKSHLKEILLEDSYFRNDMLNWTRKDISDLKKEKKDIDNLLKED